MLRFCRPVLILRIELVTDAVVPTMRIPLPCDCDERPTEAARRSYRILSVSLIGMVPWADTGRACTLFRLLYESLARDDAIDRGEGEFAKLLSSTLRSDRSVLW